MKRRKFRESTKRSCRVEIKRDNIPEGHKDQWELQVHTGAEVYLPEYA